MPPVASFRVKRQYTLPESRNIELAQTKKHFTKKLASQEIKKPSKADHTSKSSSLMQINLDLGVNSDDDTEKFC